MLEVALETYNSTDCQTTFCATDLEPGTVVRESEALQEVASQTYSSTECQATFCIT